MKMRIAVAGAGIGGLSAAGLLAGDGHHVEVFDQFEAPAPVGSGLVIQPVGLEVLDALDAGWPARHLGARIERLLGHEVSAGRRVLDVSYGDNPERHGLGIHRAALFQVLLEAATGAGARIHPGHKVAGRNGQRLNFESGQSEEFDLIVDACGATSPLSPLQARTLPYGAIWATVPWPDEAPLPADQLSQRYRRADRMLGVLPVGAMPDQPDQQLAAIFYSLSLTEHPTWRAAPFADWLSEASSLWPEFAPFLAPLKGHEDFSMARYSHGRLHKPISDGMAHIGDAAHRASPQLGQGANMALLDARALQLALRRTSGREALRLYAGSRRWHVLAYQSMSAAFTPQYQSDSRWLPRLRDHILAPLSRLPPIPRILTRLVCGDLLPPMPSLTPRSK